MFINPGSIGQPRNGQLPSYLVFDFETKKSELDTFTMIFRGFCARSMRLETKMSI
jgi:predicted phosphodiesterase